MMPDEVAIIRQETCQREKCRYRKKLNFHDPCASCPNEHWGRYSTTGCDDPKRKAPKQKKRLGDRIASVAQPIARTIDRLTRGRTQVAKCGGCKSMKDNLNAGMSIRTAIRKRFSQN